ncbi:MAG TPA: YkgJ family cysteine cluster protein [Blastocatellia bacterium]|nr:YkgJ family cysteine cluster protein [Blastocatellia bacterium]
MNEFEQQKAIVDDIHRGLVYAHNRANANTTEVHQANATLNALVELLVDRGLVNIESLEARRKQAAEQLRRTYLERGMAVAMQEFGVSKYEFKGGTEIDCDKRIELCKAACCRLPFALSKQDVKEGIIEWDLGQPYMNARGADGYCSHLDRCSGECAVYQQRPIPCRGYDCREDKRIWIDFERRIINPALADSNWPECIEEEPAA